MRESPGGLIVIRRGAAPPGEEHGVGETVSHPAKLLRIAVMIRELLGEVRDLPLDEESRARLGEIVRRTVGELDEVLSEDLRRELRALVPRLGEVPPPVPGPARGDTAARPASRGRGSPAG